MTFGFFCFVLFFVANKSDFVLPKICMLICKDIPTESYSLHDLWPCIIDSNECFYALLNISVFWDTRFCHLREDMGFWYQNFEKNIEKLQAPLNTLRFCLFCYHTRIRNRVKVHSYYVAIAMRCRTAPYCAEIAMWLHCGIAWKLNSF